MEVREPDEILSQVLNGNYLFRDNEEYFIKKNIQII